MVRFENILAGTFLIKSYHVNFAKVFFKNEIHRNMLIDNKYNKYHSLLINRLFCASGGVLTLLTECLPAPHLTLKPIVSQIYPQGVFRTSLGLMEANRLST